MKKIVLCLMLILGVFMITGCTVKKKDNNEEAKVSEVVTVTAEGHTLELDKDYDLHDISFKYPSAGEKMTGNNYFMLDYHYEYSFVFRISVDYYEGKTFEEALASKTVTNKGTKTFEGKEWTLYQGKTMTGETTNYYMYKHNNDSYSVFFAFNKDNEEFIKNFMSTVKFK